MRSDGFLHIRFPTDLKAEFAIIAKRKQITMSSLAVDIIAAYVKAERSQASGQTPPQTRQTA